MINGSPKPGRRGPRLALAIALGAAAAAGVYMYVNSIQQQAVQNTRLAAQQAIAQPPTRAKVVFAKVSLAAGTALTPDNVELRDTPVEAVQPNAVTAVSDTTGKVVTVPIAAGEQILSH